MPSTPQYHDPLTGDLPALVDADEVPKRTSEAARAAFEQAVGTPAVRERTTVIDDYIVQKSARLADVRKAVGLTQLQVAEELGVSQPQVSKLENSGTHMVETLDRFITATGGRMRILVEYDNGIVEYRPGFIDERMPAAISPSGELRSDEVESV